MAEAPRLPDSPLTDPDALRTDPRWDRWRRRALPVAWALIGVYGLVVGGVAAYRVSQTYGEPLLPIARRLILPLMISAPALLLSVLLLRLALRAGRYAWASAVTAGIVAVLAGVGHVYVLIDAWQSRELVGYSSAMLAGDTFLFVVAVLARQRSARAPALVAALALGGGHCVWFAEIFAGGVGGFRLGDWVFWGAWGLVPTAGCLIVLGLVLTMPRAMDNRGMAGD